MRDDEPLALKDSIRQGDLTNEPLILSEQSLRSNELSGWFNKSMESLKVVATYNLVHNATYLVEEGIGYALLIDRLVNTNGRKLCFRPLEPRLEGRMNIAWKKHKIFSKAADLFLNKILETNRSF